jgi:hypothetical protein
MLVFDGYAMIADDEQSAATPLAGADSVESTDATQRP